MGLPASASRPVTENGLTEYYQRLLAHFGPQGWWPARTRIEVILGTILTQNTSWRNAELALGRLRRAGLLRLKRLCEATVLEIEVCARPAGFYRQKAAAIHNFVDWLERAYGSSLNRLFAVAPEELRNELLTLKGLGPETVDAILLYAGKKPFFVADDYTRRVLCRHGMLPQGAGYASAQEFLHRCLPRNERIFNEFHALLVEAGKRYCRRERPHCALCPLREYLPAPPQPRKVPGFSGLAGFSQGASLE